MSPSLWWETKQIIVLVLFFGAYLLLALKGKLPTVESIAKLIALLDSKGGNIATLATFTAVSFSAGLHYIYFLLANLPASVPKNEAISTAGFAAIWGTAFGGFSGALLKSMTGQESVNRRASDALGTPSVAASPAQPSPPPGDNAK